MALPDISLFTCTSLLFSGFLAGVSNAIAGGGTFFSFPVFMAAGLPPVVANASNAIAVWPGHALASLEYRRELKAITSNIWPAIIAAALGGAVGAYLLARIGNKQFVKLVPFLLLGATGLFTFGPAFNRRLNTLKKARLGFGGITGIFLFSVYGGFFGAGLGIMLMAGLLILGIRDAQLNNALKNLLATIVTTVGTFILIMSGLIAWAPALCAFAGAVVGGLLGAKLARYLPAKWLRVGVIAMGCLLTGHYFRAYY